MAKKTIKVTFDESDPTYRIISLYGERFGARVGMSVAARIMLDHVCGSMPPFKAVSSGSALATPAQSESDEVGPLILVRDDGEIESQKHSDLLSAIQTFKKKL